MEPDLRERARENLDRLCGKLTALRDIQGHIPACKIAVAANVSLDRIYHWEGGSSYPGIINFLNWAKFFDMHVVITGPQGVCVPEFTYHAATPGWEWKELARLGATLRTARVHAGTTQTAAASATAIAPREQNRIETGHQTARPLTWCMLTAFHGYGLALTKHAP